MRVLLLSGGIESTCLAYMERPDLCVTVDYGQRQARGEIRASQEVATLLSIPHEIITVDVKGLGSGQMAGKPEIAAAKVPELWPYRNQLLITLAAMKFVGADNLRIIIGSTKSDASHVDGTHDFVRRLDELLAIQEGAVRVVAPAIAIESLDLLRQSQIDPDILDLTFSCFQAEYPCGRCRGCLKNEALRSQYYLERPTCNLAPG